MQPINISIYASDFYSLHLLKCEVHIIITREINKGNGMVSLVSLHFPKARLIK